MSYVVAVPSYNRAIPVDIKKGKHKGEKASVGTMTLNMLKEGGVPTDKVYLFVANEEQKALYKEHTDKSLYGHIVVGVKGLLPQRNFINNYFPEGKHIVQFDDDVWALEQITENKDGNIKFAKIGDLDTFFKMAFKVCEKEKAHLWGISPTSNSFYLKGVQPGKIQVGLYFCPGWGWGTINRKLKLSLPSADGAFKEDYERTLQNAVLDGKVVRFPYVVGDTEMYSVGGLDANRAKREEANIRNVKELVRRFPGLIRPNTRRKPVGSEVLLNKKVPENYRQENPDVMKYITKVSGGDFEGIDREESEDEEEEVEEEEETDYSDTDIPYPPSTYEERMRSLPPLPKSPRGSGFYPVRYMVWGRT